MTTIWQYTDGRGTAARIESTSGGSPGLNLFVETGGKEAAANLPSAKLDELVDELAEAGYGTPGLTQRRIEEIRQDLRNLTGSGATVDIAHARDALDRLQRWDKRRGELDEATSHALDDALREFPAV